MTPPFRFTLSLALSVAFLGRAQSLPKFEVAAIKPSTRETMQDPDQRRRSWGYETGRVAVLTTTVKELILRAFHVELYQIEGPEWLGREYFAVFANVPSGAPKEHIPLMFQSLLEERFKMRSHRETRMAPVYGLVIAEGGPKLKAALPDDGSDEPVAVSDTVKVGKDGSTSAMGNGAYGKVRITISADSAVWHEEFASMTMVALASSLSIGTTLLDLPVVDMTNLSGSYQVPLDIRRFGNAEPAAQPLSGQAGEVPRNADVREDSVRASLQKLGLKLVRRNAPVEKLVIDSIQKTPTEN